MGNIERLHPGVYLRDELEALGMSSKEFSLRTGISERMLSGIINGECNITFDIAYKLSSFFGNTVNFWTNLQNNYDLYLKQKEEEEALRSDWKLLKGVKDYLIKCHLIKESKDQEAMIKEARALVGVNRLSLLERKDSFVSLKEQHVKTKGNEFEQNLWIALALNEARKKADAQYDKAKLKSSISTIRSLTRKDPEYFYPELQTLLSECGVSFVLLPYLSKSNIYGATKWFNKDNVMLAISNRGKSADLFWFTLFHELSHVLMEHKRQTLYYVKGIEDQEADKMATDMLISESDWKSFVAKKVFNYDSIIAFADKVDILPCIVLGRLHKEKYLDYGTLYNKLNVSYEIVIG